MNKRLPLSFLLLPIVLLCSSCESYEFSDLQLTRQGWDTLQVETIFTKKTLFDKQTALPTNEQITLSTPSKGVFYRGPDHTIALPDRDLPSEAEITVQIQAQFENGKVLNDQKIIRASPKTYSMRNSIEYPVADATNQVNYLISFEKKRPLLEGSSDTEVLESGLSYPTTLKLFLENDPSVSISFSVQNAGGTFDLSQSSQFSTFESNLKSNISQQSRSELHVEAVSTIDGEERTFTLKSIVFEQKTKEEAIAFCRQIASGIATYLQEKVSPNTGRNASYRVNEESCTYDPITHKYNFEVSCSWDSRMFNNPFSDYRLFETWGSVTAYDTGKWEFSKSGVNQALKDSDDYEQIVGGLIVGAAVVHGLSEGNQ